MDPTILSALIGAVATIIAGVLGGIVGRSETWDRLVARNRFPRLVGTRWESSWSDMVDGARHCEKEIFEFTSQKRNRVFGCIAMDAYPDLRWEIEGDYNERFLRLLWHPSKEAPNKFFVDYGCYFFERQGDGSFKGYAIGFDAHLNKLVFSEHILKQLAPVRAA